MAQMRAFHIYQWHMKAAKMVKCENSDKINNHSTRSLVEKHTTQATKT